jgi:hypothetical protein
MSTESDIALVVAHCRNALDLAGAQLPAEYRYAGVAHCVLDAVFSTGVRYESTRAVVERYCEYRRIPVLRPTKDLPPAAAQEPLSAFVSCAESLGPAVFATQVVQNQQRTSTRSGILKADAAMQFARVLRSFDVEVLQDLQALANDNALNRGLRAITGQSSGVAIDYFWMLAGTEDLVKPDRMVMRFLGEALSRHALTSTTEASALVIAAAKALRTECPGLTARLLDYAIWQHARRA